MSIQHLDYFILAHPLPVVLIWSDICPEIGFYLKKNIPKEMVSIIQKQQKTRSEGRVFNQLFQHEYYHQIETNAYSLFVLVMRWKFRYLGDYAKITKDQE